MDALFTAETEKSSELEDILLMDKTHRQKSSVALAVDDKFMLKASGDQWDGWFNFEIPDHEDGAESSDEEGVTHDTSVKDNDDECADAWKNVNLDNLFKLTKLGFWADKKI